MNCIKKTNNLFFALIVLFLIISIPNVFGDEKTQTTQTINIDMFYGQGCPHCARMQSLLSDLSSSYSLYVNLYEVYYDTNNRLKLMNVYEDFGFDPNQGGVPTLVIEDRLLVIGELSEDQMKQLFDLLLEDYDDFKNKISPASTTTNNGQDIVITSSSFSYELNKIKTILEENSNDINNSSNTIVSNETLINETHISPLENNSTNSSSTQSTQLTQSNNTSTKPTQEILTWGVLIPAALIDSINPCTFAVIAILLAAVLLNRGKKQVFISGLLFTLAIFISYLLMGFGVFKAITSTGLQNAFYILITILAFLMAFFEIRAYFNYKPGFGAVEMPLFLRPKLKKLMRFVNSPITAFLIGLICSLFLLPCSSGPYLMVLGMLAKQTTILNISYLVVYNLIFILPLLLITLLVSLGATTVSKIHEKKEQYIKYLHLISGILVLVIINFLTVYLYEILKYVVLVLVTLFEIVVIVLLLVKFFKSKTKSKSSKRRIRQKNR